MCCVFLVERGNELIVIISAMRSVCMFLKCPVLPTGWGGVRMTAGDPVSDGASCLIEAAHDSW